MGLTIYNQTGTSLTINTEYDIAPILKQSFINCFCESTSGYIWVGTRNGLFGLKENAKELLQYTTVDGLPSNVIYGILEDSYGRLWISTNQGLSCLTPEAENYVILLSWTVCRVISSMPVLIVELIMGTCFLEGLMELLRFGLKRLLIIRILRDHL